VSQVEQTQKLQTLLHDLSEAVEKVALLKSQLGGGSDEASPVKKTDSESTSLREKIRISEDDKSRLESELRKSREETASARGELAKASAKAEFLGEEGRAKGDLCQQLTESVHRARQALNEEREKNEKLDRKLEGEQRAAKKIALDITRYVEQMKMLEREVADLRRQRKKRGGSGERHEIDMRGDTLAVVRIEEEEQEVLAKKAAVKVAPNKRESDRQNEMLQVETNKRMVLEERVRE
jgi:chromosome segregation ATPase